MLLEKIVCYDQCVLLTKLLAFALHHFVLQGQLLHFRLFVGYEAYSVSSKEFLPTVDIMVI